MKIWAFLVVVFVTVMGAAATPWMTLEQYGGEAYYKRFDGLLIFVPHSAAPTIVEGLELPEGRHYTRIHYTGPQPVFDDRDLGKSFCGLFAHKNPGVPDAQHPDLFYPNIVGSRYAKVVRVLDGKTIVVDFEFNGGDLETPRIVENRKGYIFFDNSDAWAALVADFARPENTRTEIRLREHTLTDALQTTYAVPQYSMTDLPAKPLTLWTGTAKKARVKFGIEDYFQWDRVGDLRYRQDAYLFRISTNDHNLVIHNIAWIPPHRTVSENFPITRGFFGTAAGIGPCERIIAIINNTALDEQREIQVGSGLTEERIRGLGVGFVYSGGTYQGEGLTEDVAGYQYVLLKNYEHTANSLIDLKASSGAGNYLVMEDVTTDFSDQAHWNPPAILAEGRFTRDKSGFHPGIIERDYYPEEVFEITSSHSFHQIDSTYHIHGWAHVANVIFVDRFAFSTGIDSTWRMIYEPLHSEGQPMFDWSLPRALNKSHMRNSRKHMIAQRIPRVGGKYVISRDYTVENTKPIRGVKDISPDTVRGFANWPLILQKALPYFPGITDATPRIDPANDIPRNAKPIQFQAGDQFRIVGRGDTLYTVQDNDRGPYWSFPHEFCEGAEGYTYTRHRLDQPLPPDLPLAFEIEMVTSTSEYLLDGMIRPAWLVYKANYNWPSTLETRFGDPTVLLTDPFGVLSYNHKQISIWARNVQHNGAYRESSNQDDSVYDLTDPDTGETLTVNRLARYSPQGATLIHCSGFMDQFTGGLYDLVRRDKIRRSLGKESPDAPVAKLRLFGCREIKVPPEAHYLVEIHATDEGAPDMPAACRSLLDSLPSGTDTKASL